MANRYSTQFVASMNKALFEVGTRILIGGTGAVTSYTGSIAIRSVTRVTTGIYQIILTDNFYTFMQGFGSFYAPVTGSALGVDASGAALSISQVYQIVTLGVQTAANWTTLGMPPGITPAVGIAFVAAATGAGATSGAGTVKAIGVSGIGSVEIMGNPNLTMGPTGAGNQGGIILIQTLQPQQTGTTTNNTPVRMTPADPISGSSLELLFLLSNSSV